MRRTSSYLTDLRLYCKFMHIYLNKLLAIPGFITLGITGGMDYICGHGFSCDLTAVHILLSMIKFSCLLNSMQFQLISLSNFVICKIRAPLDCESLLAGTLMLSLMVSGTVSLSISTHQFYLPVFLTSHTLTRLQNQAADH